MRNIRLFNVLPKIPQKLQFLETLADNVWWCWNKEAIALFRYIDLDLWKDCKSNPKILLKRAGQKRLEELSEDPTFLKQLEEVREKFQAEVEKPEKEKKNSSGNNCIAYFSLEHGLHESIRLYSGGLGILAGDHLKSASELELPMVGVGLLYRQGYFRQTIDKEGWQNEHYPDNNIEHMPLSRARDADGGEIMVSLRLADQVVHAIVWQMKVGNVKLYLLDTEIPENSPDMRSITWRLYGGDKKMRLHQELLLGIAGHQALVKLGYEPKVCHINEGHAAFISLARISHLIETKDIDYNTAIQIAWRTNIFTTHTPVPAGNEVFDIDLLRPYLEALQEDLHLDPARILRWGLPPDSGEDIREFSMTILGLRMANYSNGVSKLHGQVARNMWAHLWPDKPKDEVPIKHVTNGVHVRSWVSRRNQELYDRYLSPGWEHFIDNETICSEIDRIPDTLLWQVHQMEKADLVHSTRSAITKQLSNLNATEKEKRSVHNCLDPYALTIGFARRFATYKRATLLLSDKERLANLLKSEDKPVQFIFAGKAHPADEKGKSFIHEIIQFAKEYGVSHRVVFLEDYDIRIARTMVHGVDVWLNNPERPKEASGTSGMKVAINGGINCSILDGWWAEAYCPECGWAIPSRDDVYDEQYRNVIEAQALFNILENEIIPCYYSRKTGEMPAEWIAKIKESLKMALYNFSSNRMVYEYKNHFYAPALEAYDKLTASKCKYAKELAQVKQTYYEKLGNVNIGIPQIIEDISHVYVNDKITVRLEVYLDGLDPEQVDVELYYGPVDPTNQVISSNTAKMNIIEDKSKGNYLYEAQVDCQMAGRFGVTARLTPAGNIWDNHIPNFVVWSD
ncbi:alpha-glucan family phosphorylase [Sedimentisphaera salicampi]|uniref:Glycogen phosphorylase n=1 Tax=Sedimentisphaera salicampi TaxID=1941349 RepID=A0A1W6LJ87_9BACT|nr:alpha-glucan family phosphorylase [Sedimentisphaera salicampi]ARN55803.1 Glycogen phosphorylase [Sedimentisphaera salicampi]OXU15996.1 Glycogen phosphorylase [Sedimentisphaera salicampi]